MSALPDVLVLLLAGFTLLNCAYYLYFSRFWIFSKESKTKSSKSDSGVSIISCVKNEAPNLPALLECLAKQNYPVFQIIFVNDHSTDDSPDILNAFALRNPNCHIVNLQSVYGKKAGITQAVHKAQYDKLLLIDADCTPVSSDWLSLMTEKIIGKKQIVLGYGGYRTYQRSVLNTLIRFETLFTAMQYFAYAKAKNAYMGMGRNLAYTKELFNRAEGFKKHLHHKAGDDDLFVNQNATRENVAICLNPDAFTRSEPEKSWKSWFIQKRRHIGVSHLYKPKHQLQLGLFYISQLAFYSLAIASLTVGYGSIVLPVLLIFRELLVLRVIVKVSIRLKERNLALYTLILEPFMISVQMLIFISNIVVKPRRWN